MTFRTRALPARILLAAFIGLVVSGLVALGFSAPALAVNPTSVNVTIKVVNKAGTALTAVAVFPIEVSDGVVAPGGADLAEATALPGKPGYFTATLETYTTYTFEIDPTGAAAATGDWQLLGGGQDVDQAQTFEPTPTNTFLTATYDNEGVITGKVYSPTGVVLKGAEADLYLYDGGQWQNVSYSLTSSTGVYTMTNVQPGSYRLKFWSPTYAYPPIYSGSATSLANAATIVVAPGKTVTENAKFTTYNGSISGTALINFDGQLGGGPKAIATAYPVLTFSGNAAATIDYGRAVASAPANANGVWTISNLPPGQYVVHIEPYYYNEAQGWVGASPSGEQDDSSAPVGDATVFTVVSGSKIATGTTILGFNDNSGADPEISLTDPTVTAQVTLTNPADGYEYASGIASGGLAATLEYSDGSPVQGDIEPGLYTVTVVDVSGQHEPYSQNVYLDFGYDPVNVVLQARTAPVGFSSAPAIAQTDLQVGTEYTVAATQNRGDGVLSYQWLRDGQPIYAATGASYTSTGADYNHHISVRVTTASFGFSPVTENADVAASDSLETPGDAPTNSGAAPSISPSAGVFTATVLQANVGQWSDTGMNFTYQWQSNGADITGATGSTYTVVSGDIGNQITVNVTGHKAGYADSAVSTSSNSVTPAAHPAPVNTKAPVITKTVVKGVTTWSTTAGTWSVAGVTYHYEWDIDGLPQSITSKYSTTTPLSGDPLELTVSATKDGYLPGEKTLIVQKGTNAFTEDTAPQVLDATPTATPITGATAPVYVGDSLYVGATADWTVDGSIAPDGYAYQWYRQATGKSAVAIVGATKTTYVVSSLDVGDQLSVRETTVSATFTAASAFAPAGLGTVSPALVNTPATVTLHGVAAQGQTLSATIGAWPTTAVTSSYQWLECPTTSVACTISDPTTYLPISKATKSTLPVLSAYGNIALRITGTKAGYTAGVAYSTAAGTDAANQIVTLSTPAISGLVGGQAKVGVKLTAVSGKYSVAGVTVHYSWLTCAPTTCQASGAEQVSTAATYTPTAADFGSSPTDIQLVETVTKTGYISPTTTDTSFEEAIVKGTIAVTKAPTVTTATNQWTVNNGTYGVPAGSTFVSWFVDGTPANLDPSVSQPTLDREYLPSQSVWATVTYSADGYNDATSTLIVQKGTLTLADPESVTGAQYGDHLGLAFAAPYTDAANLPVTLSYQWYSNNVVIKGATAATFTPSTAYIGHHIDVRVTASNPYYTTTSTTTTYSFVFGYGTLGTPDAPTITYTGTLQPGVVMTSAVNLSSYATTGVTITRQWLREAAGGTSFVAIPKATAATYTPAATDVGAQFEVYVSSSKVGYVTQHAYTAPVTVQYSPTLATLTPPVVSGTPTVGSLLTANVGTWNTPSLTYTYQWYRDDVLIPGATASTYTPDFTSATDTLSFTVTASRVGYQPVTVTSNDQVIGLGTITAVALPKVTGTASSTAFSVSTGSWNVDGLTFSYQWQVGGVDATGTGATTDTYTRSGSDVGALTVLVTITRTGYTPLTITVNGPALVALP